MVCTVLKKFDEKKDKLAIGDKRKLSKSLLVHPISTIQSIRSLEGM